MIIRISKDKWINLKNVEMITLTKKIVDINVFDYPPERNDIMTLNFHCTSGTVYKYHDTLLNIMILLKKYKLDL